MPVVGISLLVVEQPYQSADVVVASVTGVSANMTYIVMLLCHDLIFLVNEVGFFRYVVMVI